MTPAPDTDSSISSTTKSPLSTVFVSVGGTTVPTVIQITATPPPDNGNSNNKIGIAVGVVVAVVAVASIIGGLLFWMRHKKRQALEEERQRHEMMTSFVTGEKPGTSYSMSDSRLDPGVMFQRRLSDGSIRDNEDYSRRILKVNNYTVE
jgi:cell wall integrity and stress response component